MKWSKYQQNIYKDVADGEGHTIVEAIAGGSKTTVLLESLNHIPEGKSWLFVAFNKRIAEELQRRAPSSFNGECKTLHSLGLRTVFKAFPKIKVDNNKARFVLDRVIGKDKKLWELKASVARTVGLAKSYLIDGAEYIDYIMENNDIDTCEIDRAQYIKYVQTAMEKCREDTSLVDFADMIWFPYVYNLSPQKYDRVFIDEAQDLSAAQISLALSACKQGGRVMATGDKNQAIYSWAGASLNSLENLKKKLQAKSLPLSISYRCPKSVVKEAQQFVPHMESAPDAPDGIVKTITRKEMLKLAKPGCFILSRVNAPLVGLALGFIKKSIPAIIQGRDIGQNLIVLIKKSRKKNLDSFLTWLDSWEKREVARLRKKRMDSESITDKAACLRALGQASHDLTEVKQKIKSLFEDTDEHGKIVLSSIHRAKGLERDVVFILKSTLRTFSQEERNVYYVGISRAKQSLFYVT